MTPELEILQFNYWEIFKWAKEVALVHPPEYPKLQELQKILNEMALKIDNLKKI